MDAIIVAAIVFTIAIHGRIYVKIYRKLKEVAEAEIRARRRQV